MSSPNLLISQSQTWVFQCWSHHNLQFFLAPGATTVINAAVGWLLFQARQWTRFNHRTSYIQIVSTPIMLLLLLTGSIISLIPILEGKKFHNLDVWYFNIITVMNVDYGDFSFTSPGGQIFASFYVFIALRGSLYQFLK